ncbi:MAG: hypothetical protein KTR25_12205 [Myxococcales bacterium]|nr:hypothetical protein [Myxococcales bacterium]
MVKLLKFSGIRWVLVLMDMQVPINDGLKKQKSGSNVSRSDNERGHNCKLFNRGL